MRTEVIKVDTIDGAVELILEELKEDDTAGTARSTTSSGRHNVVYFDGWDGLGASAVLRAVGRRLTAPVGRRAPPAAAGLEFSQVIHVDCSKWESRRETQRALAKQLKLPAPVIDMLDARDEEDDYQGVDKGSRAETPQVAGAICQHIQKLNRRFLVIFHNGSSEEIDLDSLGFPLSGYLGNKVLWSFQGRFRLYPRTNVDRALKSTRTTTDVILSAASSHNNLSHLLYQEAAEVASEINIGGVHWSAAATNCFLYTVKLYDMGSRLVDYDLATHGCNYWKCDGIIELKQGDIGTDEGADRLWLCYDALQCEMRMDWDCYQNPYLPSLLARGLPDERVAYWTSPTYGFMLIPGRIGRIPKGMFQQFDKLCVLKLSACMFSFTSPPFLCCHSLRFLWLDHCRHVRSTDDGVGKEEDLRQCFQRLWVLDVRCSTSAFLSAKMIDFMTQLRELNVVEQDRMDMEPLQGRLHNIRRFRVTKSNTICITEPENLFSGMGKLELLEFSGNYASYTDRLPWLSVGSSCSSLETVIIDGSNYLPGISLRGCVKLKNLFLSGLFPRLRSLDVTGSAVKTLDLSAVTVPFLDELILLDCGKLCAILWPPEDKRKRYLGKLRVDTTQKQGTAAGDHRTGRLPPPTGFNWYISVRDARLLGSLVPVKDYFGPHCANVEISTIPSPTRASAATSIAGSKDDGTEGGSRQQQMLKDNAIYADISSTVNALYEEGDYDAPVIKCCTCPPPPCVPYEGCYMHIEDKMRAGLQATSITIPGFICDSAKILHVHDSLFITSILAAPLAPTTWDQLEWCRVERCPKLECVISSQNGAGPGGRGSDTDMFKKLRTIWASHLPNTRYIWSWSVSVGRWDSAFMGLTLLHLDYCPRLIYVTHLAGTAGLESLETLEIMWCGDLSMVFKGPANWRQFPNLKHIHLHELPKLQDICDSGCRVHAAKLETIKIRGCWNLKRLPYVGGENVAECDCEKEWWDRLEWDSFVEPSLQYKRTHPRHYKKTMLRGSVLR